MTINTEDLLNSIMDSLDRIDYIKPEDIPNIDLYMDQVTTFIDKKLRASARYPGDDKILTKTMINNYAKNDLLPPPVKKKYSREHVLVMIFIYYYKGFLSINDIWELLHPLTERFFQNGQEFNLEKIYREVFSLEKDTVERMKEDIREKYERSETTFTDAPEESAEFLRRFAFICELSFDVYVKKQLIEKLIDELYVAPHSKGNDSKKKKKEEGSRQTGEEST